MFRDLVSVGPEDHSPTIVSDLDVCFAEALAYTASLTSGVYTTFRRHLDPRWIRVFVIPERPPIVSSHAP